MLRTEIPGRDDVQDEHPSGLPYDPHEWERRLAAARARRMEVLQKRQKQEEATGASARTVEAFPQYGEAVRSALARAVEARGSRPGAEQCGALPEDRAGPTAAPRAEAVPLRLPALDPETAPLNEPDRRRPRTSSKLILAAACAAAGLAIGAGLGRLPLPWPTSGQPTAQEDVASAANQPTAQLPLAVEAPSAAAPALTETEPFREHLALATAPADAPLGLPDAQAATERPAFPPEAAMPISPEQTVPPDPAVRAGAETVRPAPRPQPSAGGQGAVPAGPGVGETEAPEIVPGPLGDTHAVLLVPPRAGAAGVAEATAALAGLGVTDWTRRPVSFTVSETHLRYYHAADAEAAEALGQGLGAPVRDFTDYRPKPEAGLVEIYVSGQGSARASGSGARYRTSQGGTLPIVRDLRAVRSSVEQLLRQLPLPHQ